MEHWQAHDCRLCTVRHRLTAVLTERLKRSAGCNQACIAMFVRESSILRGKREIIERRQKHLPLHLPPKIIEEHRRVGAQRLLVRWFGAVIPFTRASFLRTSYLLSQSLELNFMSLNLSEHCLFQSDLYCFKAAE